MASATRTAPVCPGRPRQARIRGIGLLLCLLLPGCSNTAGIGMPSVVLDTQMGATTLVGPGSERPGDVITPPPGMAPGMAAVVDRSGLYAGTAAPLTTGGGQCIQTLDLTGFRVQGNAVRFGGFRGTIAPDGGLQMVYGRRWIIGQFEGTTFHGHLSVPGQLDQLGCTYALTFRRAAA